MLFNKQSESATTAALPLLLVETQTFRLLVQATYAFLRAYLLSNLDFAHCLVILDCIISYC